MLVASYAQHTDAPLVARHAPTTTLDGNHDGLRTAPTVRRGQVYGPGGRLSLGQGSAALGRNMPEPRPEGDYLRKFGHLPGG